jgi:NTE family protein
MSPLRTTLESLVDFDRINSGKTRLSLGAVNIRLGNFVYFEPPALTASAMRSKTEKTILDGFRTGAFSHSLDRQRNSAT